MLVRLGNEQLFIWWSKESFTPWVEELHSCIRIYDCHVLVLCVEVYNYRTALNT